MKVLYFAWLRERLNRGEEIISPPDNIGTIAELMDWLAQNDEGIELAFEKRDLIKTALDENIVPHDTPLADAKTIAFFPPMTGG